jgi:hypothetical protein
MDTILLLLSLGLLLMAIVKWDAPMTSRGNVLNTTATILTTARTNPTGGTNAGGTEVDNSTNLDMYGKLEISLTYATAPAAGGYINIYMMTAPDGTNYDDGDASVAPPSVALVCSIPVRAVTTAQKLMSPLFLIPPTKLKFILENMGSTTISSGATVELFTVNEEVA